MLGIAAAIAFAFLAHVRVSPFSSPHLEYRKPVLWSSKVTLQLTQEGFPEGRVQDVGSRRSALVSLAPLYARLANTDAVRARMRRFGPIYGGVKVQPLVDDNNVSLPLLRISSFAFSNANATIRARRQASAFIGFIEQQQRQNDLLPRNRVALKVVSGPSSPVVVVPRKLTLPVVVFLSMLIATGALILTLENRARRRPEAQMPLIDLAGTDDIEQGVAVESRRETGAPPERSPVPVAPVKPVADVPPAARGHAVPLSRPERTLGSEPMAENGKPHAPDTTSTDGSETSKRARRAGASRRGYRG